MGILAFIVVGLIAGLLARLVMPGRGPLGLIVTALMGIAGAFVGGFLVQLLGGAGVTGINVWSILVATLGAVVLLAIYRLFAGGRTV
ncbi:MAG: GlsB/YeaQ/YmgE family stress response membrane protein [Actinomycetota bacterium]|jgi:uncharacterized membrane protein YeaQ/YmgE (transglycosylase-associated protein family)|nr:GlsB/YeaQ/YmgE family stress response membrane protein [Actinomycetota bacterium]